MLIFIEFWGLLGVCFGFMGFFLIGLFGFFFIQHQVLLVGILKCLTLC